MSIFQGIGDPGIGDPGIGDPGIGDPGIGDPGIGDPGIGDNHSLRFSPPTNKKVQKKNKHS
jgi:hypothetical protein